MFNCIGLPCGLVCFSELALVVVAHSDNWSQCGMGKPIDDTALLVLVPQRFYLVTQFKSLGGRKKNILGSLPFAVPSCLVRNTRNNF